MNNRPAGGRSSETVSPHRHEQQQQQQRSIIGPSDFTEEVITVQCLAVVYKPRPAKSFFVAQNFFN
jgi:hypothetical protein